MRGSAIFSPCGLYRYELRREWDSRKRQACFVMLNPSTADANVDDPTIRKCIGFANRWGFGSLVVVNLFAFRATDPRELRWAKDPIGPENDEAIARAAPYAERIVCAWGQLGSFQGRDAEVVGLLPPSFALRVAKNGAPHHPLYVPYSAGLIPFHARAPLATEERDG